MNVLRRFGRWIANSHLPAAVSLTALNLVICRRLFEVEYTNHFSSIEGSFIAIARYMSRHWGDFSWWPLWHCGMPFPDTYVPLLHLSAAITATLGHMSAAYAYHRVIGVTYALGPAALYWMAARLGAPRGAAFLSALWYSLFSPSTLLMPEVAHDVGGIWFSRRLQVLTVYGEGPHVTAMTMLPVAIAALENALRKWSGRGIALAALAIALVFLTNVPGTMALGLAVFCWICVQPRGSVGRAWLMAAAASLLAYGVACYGVPPSSLGTVFGNVGSMHSGFSNSLRYGPLPLALALGAAAGAGWLLGRTRVSLWLRFAILSFALIAPLAVTARSETFELLPQVGRLHLEMEMGACLLLGWLGWRLYEVFPRWVRPLVLALSLAPIGIQFDHYTTRAAFDTQPADLEKRSEYTTARWLDANLRGQRVYVAGSTSFWLNAFTDTPQLVGCCDQGESMPVLTYVEYVVNSRVLPKETEAAKIWLQVLGVRALVVSAPESTDVYKDIKSPERFQGGFEALHQENGDTIYAILPDQAPLAHVIRPGEEVPLRALHKIEYADFARYAMAVFDRSRAPAGFRWLHNGEARIRANLRRDDRVSVQVAWFPGWKAYVGGQSRKAEGDGLGLVEIQPECEGNCEIALVWTGRWDTWLSLIVSLASLAAVVAVLWRGGAAIKFPSRESRPES